LLNFDEETAQSNSQHKQDSLSHTSLKEDNIEHIDL